MTTSVQLLQSVPKDTSIEEILAIVERDGGVILKDFLSRDQIDRFNADVDGAMQALEPGSKHENEIIQAFHGSNTKRLTNLVTLSPTFREEIIDHDLVHQLCDAVFLEESGTYWMTTAQVIEIGPGNSAQQLHRDLENWHPFVQLGKDGPEAILNFLIAFTDFTE